MQLTQIEKNGITCAIVNGSEPVIIDAQTALDVLMSAKYDIGTKNIVIDKKTDCGGLLHSQQKSCRRAFTEICELRWSHCNLWRLFSLHKQAAERLYL